MTVSEKVNLRRLSYVIYEHPDLSNFLKFCDDFGFEPVGYSDNDGSHFLRGYGPDPYLYIAQQAPEGQGKRFCGAGFTARTEGDFERACNLEGAQLKDISHRPGGGKMVSVPDVNGYEIQIVYGQEERVVPEKGLSSVFDGRPNVNGAITKVRKGIFNRMGNGPAKIHKLGHFGYMTDNYTATCAWYSDHFNFKPTDIVHKPGDPSAELMSFFHLDLGAEYSDHHCLLVAAHHGNGKGTVVHHSSFEVEDIDTQMMGHQWLHEKGYRAMWGVGRHIMGSQVFDYWYDPTGFVIEHYADGDVVNGDTPTIRSGGTAAAIWGPPMPTKWD
ncbi:related to 2,3-dihydroxybiphenyl-1,2-dioxygenase [Cephalotrichum gorgonifer]|uniref:Related to 2,3-dihydroxybiphenyl-1,2-dioxygenase n=1 Tax=Cephalotrichum gorgonifer TaxID=2041049 RepID=A0AAE8SX29_9PEZI|nr:related to 2,3-dihydroxybiphenyl-1,2-dioxygenase [Cephalotrichum gorgonifer]